MKYVIATLLTLALAAPSFAGCFRAAVVQKVRVQKAVAVKQAVVVEKVRVAQVVTPVVQVTEVKAFAVAPVVAGYGYAAPDSGRLERLERAVEKLADTQLELFQRLTAPK